MDSATTDIAPLAGSIDAVKQNVSPAAPLRNGIDHLGTASPQNEQQHMAESNMPERAQPITLLEDEERAGGPPLPSAAGPAISAVRGSNSDEIIHAIEGHTLPNGGSARGLHDQGMPGDARELAISARTEGLAPPMSADVDQPMHSIPAETILSEDASSQNEGFSINSAPQQVLPSTLAPATAPETASETNMSSVSNTSLPPSPGRLAASLRAPEEVKPNISGLESNPSTLTKRPIIETEEREKKRQRYESPLAESLDPVSQQESKSSATMADRQTASDADQADISHVKSGPIERVAQVPQEEKTEGNPGQPFDPAASMQTAMPSLQPLTSDEMAEALAIEQTAPVVTSGDPSAKEASSPGLVGGSSSATPTGTIAPGDLSQPLAAPVLPPPPTTHQNKLPREHQRFAESIVKQLKKMRESLPFLVPVDPVALNIPTYFNFIKYPMDLGTIEKKLRMHKYVNIDEWIADVRLIWSNCYTFNGPPGPSAPVSISAKVLEDTFEKQVPKIPTPKPPAPPKPKALPGYSTRPSGGSSPTTTRRASGDGRIRREVRAPVQYEPDFEDPLRVKRTSGPMSGQMRYCRDIIRELLKKSNESFTYPFLHPVDPIALNIPDYHRIVKKPMDLSTVKKNFDQGEYATPEHFAADVRLICKNCFIYNPVGTPVHEMGRKLEHLFESKWRDMPEPGMSEDEDGFDDEGSTNSQIQAMERQIAMMKQQLHQRKNSKSKVAPPKQPKPAASRSNRPSAEHQRRPSGSLAASSGSNKVDYLSDDFVYDEPEVVSTPAGPREITFDMKRELATKITTFEGAQLEKAIDIIRTSAAHLLGDESKEIELDIDMLDTATLLKLYNFVVLGGSGSGPKSPQRRKPEATLTAAGVRAQKSGRAGTGGLKGTHLDESIESAKIAALEQKLSALENNGVGLASPTAGSPGNAANTNANDYFSSSDDGGDSSDSGGFD